MYLPVTLHALYTQLHLHSYRTTINEGLISGESAPYKESH